MTDAVEAVETVVAATKETMISKGLAMAAVAARNHPVITGILVASATCYGAYVLWDKYGRSK